MAYDASYYARSGDKPLLTATLNAPTGTLYTITAGVFSLTSSAGALVLPPTSVTAHTPGAAAQPTASFLLDTGPYPAPGVYAGRFLLTVTSSADSSTRQLSYEVELIVALAFETEGAAYDPNTLIGQVRFQAADTNLAQAYFSDAELLYCLSIANQDARLAAAEALDKLATDDARLAYLERIGEYTKDKRQLASEIAARAKYLRSLTIQGPVINPPQQIFQPNYGPGQLGNMNVW